MSKHKYGISHKDDYGACAADLNIIDQFVKITNLRQVGNDTANIV